MKDMSVLARLLTDVNDLRQRVAQLEADAAGMPAYANPLRYYRVQSGGKSSDGFGPEITCPACNGRKFVEPVGEYETNYDVDGRTMRACPLCIACGVIRDRLSIDQLNALRDTP